MPRPLTQNIVAKTRELLIPKTMHQFILKYVPLIIINWTVALAGNCTEPACTGPGDKQFILLAHLYLVLGMSALATLYLMLGIKGAVTTVLLSLVDTALFVRFSIPALGLWSLLQAIVVALGTWVGGGE